MKAKIIFGLLFVSSFAFAKVNVVVSVVPQKSFVEAIGGENVKVDVMVAPGSSPHSYEPKPSQMKNINNAQIYFTIGVEFENAWLNRFASQNKNMKIVDSSKNVKRIIMKEHSHKEEKVQSGHKHTGLDPHIWTNPMNIKIIGKNILDSLVALDSPNRQAYETNYKKFVANVDATDKQIKEILKNTKRGTKFMVFHPAWGYFANQYGLEQLSIEVEGKEPKPKELARIFKEAKEENVKAIFAQPEFSDKSAQIIANTLNIKVIKESPLNSDWSNSLIGMAQAISK